MTRLFGLREWVSLPDAAAYLQRLLGEEVREVDVLQFALDGLLPISVRFVNGAMARLGTPPNDELDVDQMGQLSLAGSHPEPQVIDGVWDLTLFGSGSIELERRVQALTGGPEVIGFSVGGLYLVSPDRGRWAELAELVIRDVAVNPNIVAEWPRGVRIPMVTVDKSYVATHELPGDALLVARTAALETFVASVLSGDETPAAAVADEPSRPIPKQAAQELAILSKLHDLGVDPLAVPAAPPGKPSVTKEAVRKALGYSPEVMRKAWLRLRADGRLKDA